MFASRRAAGFDSSARPRLDLGRVYRFRSTSPARVETKGLRPADTPYARGAYQLTTPIAEVSPAAEPVTVSPPPPFDAPVLSYVNVLLLSELPFGIVRAVPVLNVRTALAFVLETPTTMVLPVVLTMGFPDASTSVTRAVHVPPP